LGVPELWRYTQQGLEIFLLKKGKYLKSESSPNFPNILIVALVNKYVQQCLTIGRSQAMRNLRNWIKDNL
jgi:hypothetical protein